MVKPNSCLVDQRLREVSLVLLTIGSDCTFLWELLYWPTEEGLNGEVVHYYYYYYYHHYYFFIDQEGPVGHSKCDKNYLHEPTICKLASTTLVCLFAKPGNISTYIYVAGNLDFQLVWILIIPCLSFCKAWELSTYILSHNFGKLEAYFALDFDFGPKCKIMLGIRHKIRHGQANL